MRKPKTIAYQHNHNKPEGRRKANRKKVSISGYIQDAEILNETMKIVEQTHHIPPSERSRIATMLQKNGMTYKKERVEKKIENWKEKRAVRKKEKKPKRIWNQSHR